MAWTRVQIVELKQNRRFKRHKIQFTKKETVRDWEDGKERVPSDVLEILAGEIK